MIIAMRFYWMFDYFIFCCCSTDLIACYTQPVSVVHRCFSHSHFVASYRAESRLSSHRTLIDCGRGTAYGTLCDVRSVTSQSTHRIYHASITNIIDNHSRLRHIYRFGCVSAFAHTHTAQSTILSWPRWCELTITAGITWYFSTIRIVVFVCLPVRTIWCTMSWCCDPHIYCVITHNYMVIVMWCVRRTDHIIVWCDVWC